MKPHYRLGIIVIASLALGAALRQAHAQTAAYTLCATGSSPVKDGTQCSPCQTYGVTLSSTPITFLEQDPKRFFLLLQNNGGNSACIHFQVDGSPASTSSPQNCTTITSGQPLYFTNFNSTTNTGSTIPSAISGVSTGGTDLNFMFCR